MLAPLHSLRQACCTPGIVKYSHLPQDLTKKLAHWHSPHCEVVDGWSLLGLASIEMRLTRNECIADWL